MIVETSGSYPIIGRIVRVMVRSQLLGLATCFVSISLIMAVGLRSIRNALMAQLPNMLPVALILGLLAISRNVVDVDMLGLPTVALGLAVDDTIHFLHRYQLEMSRSHNRLHALKRTFRFTGQAILQTTLILCIGLLPFALGTFLTIWMLGTYLVLTLLLAVMADLLLLPAMVKVGMIKG
jgi:predicted RND superfamily exporter protein